jgi:hypothetical protein
MMLLITVAYWLGVYAVLLLTNRFKFKRKSLSAPFVLLFKFNSTLDSQDERASAIKIAVFFGLIYFSALISRIFHLRGFFSYWLFIVFVWVIFSQIFDRRNKNDAIKKL